LDYDLIEASAGGPIKAAGAAAGGLHEFVLQKNTAYLIEFVNNSGGALTLGCRFFMYKVD
jgi:hypothetical protein